MTERTIDSNLKAGAESAEFKYIVLVRLDFPSGEVFLHNGVGNLVVKRGISENVCRYSQQYQNAWQSPFSSVITNQIVAPDLLFLADILHEDGSASQAHQLRQTITDSVMPNGFNYTCSGYAKKNLRDWLRVEVRDHNSNHGEAFFDLDAGALGTLVAPAISHAIEDARLTYPDSPPDWWRYQVTYPVLEGTSDARIGLAVAAGDNDFDIDGLDQDSLYLYGSQMEVGDEATILHNTLNGTASGIAYRDVYQGVGGFGGIDALEDSLSLVSKPINLTLSSITQEIIDAIKTDDIFGRDADIFLVALNDEYQPIGDPDNWYSGHMETAQLVLGDDDGIQIRLQSRASRLKLRNNKRYTLEDHQADHPGDLFFEFLPALQDAEVSWAGEQVRTGFKSSDGLNSSGDDSRRRRGGGGRRG